MVKDITIQDIKNYFGDIQFPVTKPDVLMHMEKKGAGSDLIEYMRKHLPERLYYTHTELLTEYENAL